MAIRCNSARSATRFAAAFLLLAGASTRAATWSEIDAGLPGSPVNVFSIVMAPARSSTLYARTVSVEGIGAIFKSTDAAASWNPLSSLSGASSLGIDPQDPSTLYAVTGRGILKSTDGGNSWSGTGAGLPNTYVGILAVDPVTSGKLYVVTGSTIFKSTDGAATWNPLDTGLPSNAFVNSLAIDPANPSRIFVLAAIPGVNGPALPAVLRSIDEGQTWNQLEDALLSSASVTSLSISATSPSMLYAIAPTGPSGTAILNSADGGDTWTAINTGLPPGASVSSLIIDPSSPSTIYLAVDFDFAQAGGILKSTDGGATWIAIKPDLPANTPIDYLAIDPAASSTFYALSSGALFKSMDGGVTWENSAAGLATLTTAALAVDPLDPSTVYTGAGAGLFKSVDGGATWNKLFAFQLVTSSVPTPIASPFADDSPAYPLAMLIDFVNPDTLYVSTTRGDGCYFDDNLLFKSVDGGMNWNDGVSPGESGCILGGIFAPSAGLKAMDPTDPKTLYLAEADDGDGYWSLLRSRDGGVTWSDFGDFPNSLQAGVWTLAIDPSTPTTLYAGIDDVPFYTGDDDTVTAGVGGVFKSIDGGTTWNNIGLTGAAVTLLVIDRTQPNVLYAATEGDYGAPEGFRGLFKSIDGGANWSAINNGLDSLSATGASVTALVIDPADSSALYAGASGGGVFKSSDGGATWTAFNDGLANRDVRVLAVAPGSGHTLYAGTSGGIFKIVDAN